MHVRYDGGVRAPVLYKMHRTNKHAGGSTMPFAAQRIADGWMISGGISAKR
jgi:hypothetical protein